MALLRLCMHSQLILSSISTSAVFFGCTFAVLQYFQEVHVARLQNDPSAVDWLDHPPLLIMQKSCNRARDVVGSLGWMPLMGWRVVGGHS
jgi:hypothetical protein